MQAHTQIQRNQLRATAIFVQIICAKTKREKKELAQELNFWHNQIRMAKAIAAKRQTCSNGN